MEPSEEGTKSASAGTRNDTNKRSTLGSLRKIYSLYIVSFLILAAVVVGFIWHDSRADYFHTLSNWNESLSSSAEARVKVVTLWREDRRMEIGLVAKNPLTERLLSASGSPGRARATQRDVERELEVMRQGYGYLAGAALDSNCQIAAQVGIRPEIAPAVNRVCQWPRPADEFKMFAFGMRQGHVWLALSVPVFAGEGVLPQGQVSRRKIGEVVMVSDPWKGNLHLIAFESTPTRTSDTLLVWQDAREALVFSPQLYARGVEAIFWQPLNGDSFESRVARERDVAFGEFTDYQGGRVFGVARRITPEGGCLVRKVDRDEALSGHRRRVALDWLVGILSLLLLASVMVALHRHVAARASQERVRQEEALRQKSQELDSFFDVALDLLCIATTDGYFLRLNPAWEATLGYTRDELKAQRFLDFVHPDDVEATLAAMATLVSQQNVTSFLNRYRCKDGTYRWLQWRSAPGNKLIYAAARDVTEQRNTEEALKRRAAFDELMTRVLARFATCAWSEVDASIVSALQAIAEFTGADHGYVIMFSADRTTWRATHEWCGPHVPPRLQEYQNIKFGTQAWSESRLLADEIIRFDSTDEMPPEASAERQHYEAEGVLSALDVPIKAAAGITEGCVGLQSSARPIAWSDTDVAHLRMVGDAIATVIERQRAEQALRESDQRYRDFISHSNEGVWRLELEQPIPIDLSREEVMRRVFQYGFLAECNVAYARLLGFSTPEELLGRRPQDLLLAPEGRSESIRPSEQGGLRAETVEIHGFDRAGNRKHLLRTQIPIVENGMLVRVWGILHDFTELRQAEEELRRSEQRWRAVFENSAVGIAMADCISYRIQGANSAFQKMTGYTEEEMRAFSFMDITHEDDREPNRQHIAELLAETRPSFAMEKRYRRKDGSLIWVNMHVSLVPGTGTIPQFSIAIVEDITERKQAEAALRESEQLFRRMSEASFEGIIFAEDGNVIDANPLMADMLGYRLQDLIGAKIAEVVAAESLEVVQAHIAAGSEELYEHKARRKDGSIFPVEARGAAVFWKGRLLRATVIRDITERKRAEEALRASEARFRTLITEARVAMGVGRNGITLFVNTEYVKLFGLQNPEETIGRSILDQHAPQCHEWMKDMIRRRRQGLPTPNDFESVGRRKDGSTFPMHCAVSHISLADGPVTLGFLTDLTERKRAEEALRERERRYRLLFENNEAGVSLATLDDRLLDCNEVMASMFGYESREDMLSQEVWSLYFDPSDRRLLAEKLKRDGRLSGERLRCRKKDGTPVWVLYSASLIPEEGKAPNLVQVTAIDISGLEQAEQELQRSFEQLRALAARLEGIREEERKRVAREIHDQLGQALTAMKIDLSSLVRELPAGGKRPAKRATSILKLVDESILTVRRISTELRPGMLDDLGLVATIEWAGEDFQSRTGTPCRLDLPQEDIAVDPEQATAIFRIFQETLTNVARHADASEVAVRLAKENGALTLEVHDNGKGIPQDKLSRGESLGILGMRERAMLLGGELTISSPAGNGTTVRVRIPEAHPTSREQHHDQGLDRG